MQIPIIIAGLLLLASASYLDNCRGVLLPVLVKSFELSYGQASWFFIAGNFGAVGATVALIPLTRRFSEFGIAKVVLAIGSLGILMGGLVSGFNSLLPFATFLGIVLALLGTLSNLFILRGSDLSSRSRVFCMLHLFYGLISTMAPFAAAKFLEQGYQWYWALFAAVPLLLFIFSFIKFKLPKIQLEAEESVQKVSLSGIQILTIVIFCCYVCGEVLTSMWLVTYLFETHQYSVTQSSRYLAGFFMMMAITRAICFFSLREEREKFVLILCLAFACSFFVLGRLGYPWAFCGVGIFGPFFPLFLSRISRTFPKEARSLTLWILTLVQLTLAISHLFVGRITDWVGVKNAYWLALALIFLSLLSFLAYLPLEKRRQMTR